MAATKEQLREEIAALRSVGSRQCGGVCIGTEQVPHSPGDVPRTVKIQPGDAPLERFQMVAEIGQLRVGKEH